MDWTVPEEHSLGEEGYHEMPKYGRCAKLRHV